MIGADFPAEEPDSGAPRERESDIDRVIRTFRHALNFRGNYDDCDTCGGSIRHNVFHRGLSDHGWVLGFLTWHQCFSCAYQRPDRVHYNIWTHLSSYRMIDLIFISQRPSDDCSMQLIRRLSCSHVFSDIRSAFYNHVLGRAMRLRRAYIRELWRQNIVIGLKKVLPTELAQLVAAFRV